MFEGGYGGAVVVTPQGETIGKQLLEEAREEKRKRG